MNTNKTNSVKIVSKAASRLFLLRQFKRACSEPNELLCFYRTCIRPVAEYACQAYHNSIGESLFTLFASLTYAYHYLKTLIK